MVETLNNRFRHTQANMHRIAKNTIVLYCRQLFTMMVNLYAVRVVLNVLGVEDFGIYNVVAGIVMLFSFLSGTMASATQRYFSFALGRQDQSLLKKIFSTNLLIYLVIMFVAVILLETIGLWFVQNKLNVPADRLASAVVLYHFSVLMFLSMICAAPFMAIIIAHEDMRLYAYVSIVEAMLKLGAIFLLLYIPYEKLISYGVLLFLVSLVTTLMYVCLCRIKYEECSFRSLGVDRKLFREIFSFTGWTLFGQLSTVVRNQAVTVLLNQFFSPVIVSARAIALNVSGSINVFSNNFNTSLYPPIIKQYAAGEKKGMFRLVFNGSKITFFLIWILALPLLLRMDYVLNLWLKETPQWAVLFTQLAIVESLINSISLPLGTAARAPGKMRMYELSLGIIQIAIFPASWLVLACGKEVYTVFIVAIIANLVMFAVRLLLVHRLIGLPLKQFYFYVLLPVFGVIICSGGPALLISVVLPEGFLACAVVGLVSLFFTSLGMYFIGLNKLQRQKIQSVVLEVISKVFNFGG